jgi:putative hydrolase of HD superfamily
MDIEKIKKFLSEIQMLARVDHVGVKLAGVENPNSLAVHSLLTAQIAYLLAELEGANSEKCAAMAIFHDNNETRLGDHNKVSSRYLDTSSAEFKAEEEQLSLLPEAAAQKIQSLMNEKSDRQTKEGIIVKDADWLEVAIQAKIYLEKGYQGCQIWIDNVEKALETDSAKKILSAIKDEPDFINCWWKDIQKMTYKKLDTSNQ